MRTKILDTAKTDNRWEEYALEHALDLFYATLSSNLRWTAESLALMQKELHILHNRQKWSQSIDTMADPSIDMDADKNNGWSKEFH